MTFHFSDLYLPFQQTDGAKPPLVCLQSTERNSGPGRPAHLLRRFFSPPAAGRGSPLLSLLALGLSSCTGKSR